MADANDMDLLRDYNQRASEDAFAELVRRHVNLVYSTALRHAGNAAHAEEITQAVFVILARKASGLRPDTVLEAWLYETTRLTSLSFLRGERRRQLREQEAYMQSTLHGSVGDSTWNQIAPLLDEAMARLGTKDREAVVLRFFKEKNLREVAAAMNVTEAAAQSRVHRALEKLHHYFSKRGVSSTSAIIANEISANSVHIAPVGLAKAISAAAVAKGAATSTSTLTLVKGAMKLMAWTKAKTAVATGIGVLLVAGTASVTLKTIIEHKNDDSWRVQQDFDSRILDHASPQVRIVVSKFPRFGGFGWSNGKIMGLGAPVNYVVEAAWNFGSHRVVFSTEVPAGRYDFIASLPVGNSEALREEIKKKFGLVGHLQEVETNVLLLETKSQNAPGLAHSSETGGGMTVWNNTFKCEGEPISTLAGDLLEPIFGLPVIDVTGLNGDFDISLKWHDLNGLKRALANQLGLELVPTNMPVEMLVVEKAD